MLTRTTFQRRKHPRYTVLLNAELESESKPGQGKSPWRVKNLSRYGARIESDVAQRDQSPGILHIDLPSLGKASCTIVPLRSEQPEAKTGVVWAGELSFFEERGRRKLHTFLRSLEGKEESERRRGERRLGEAQPLTSNKRRQARRRDFGILDKCVSFAARAPGWRAMYTLFQPNQSTTPARVNIDGRELISFGSKDYLGLAHDPRVKEAAIKAIEQFGTSVSGSRAMNGTHTLHEQLEHDLALFKRTETAVVFALGYLTNVGMLTALLQNGDVAFLDERAHGSIFDGCRYSGAKIVLFRHNSAEDLRAKIRWARASRSLIVIDGVYSVDGDLANLEEIRTVAREEGIPLMVDDAHGVGILGKTGAGTTEHFGMLGEVDLDMGTFSAAFGGVGGFVACSKAVGDYLRHFSTGFTFTVGLPAPNIAAVIEALRIIKDGPALRARLWENVSRFKLGLERLGYPVSPSQAAVLAVRTGDERTTYRLDRALREHGVYVNSFCRPTVRRGEAILRLSVSASHTEEDLSVALEAFRVVRPLLAAQRVDV